MRRVLIANRGEIAVRVMRACKDHGLESVAVYSDEDRDAIHVTMADSAFSLQGTTATQTYLNIEKLIHVAKQSGADAVHHRAGLPHRRVHLRRRGHQELFHHRQGQPQAARTDRVGGDEGQPRAARHHGDPLQRQSRGARGADRESRE